MRNRFHRFGCGHRANDSSSSPRDVGSHAGRRCRRRRWINHESSPCRIRARIEPQLLSCWPCAPRRSPPQGVLVVGGTVGETSSLLLALADAAWLGQAFAHCPMKAQTVGAASRGLVLGACRARKCGSACIGASAQMSLSQGDGQGVPA